MSRAIGVCLVFVALIPLTAYSEKSHAAIAPTVAGPATTDSVWVTVSVNDTLGNASDPDTLELVWLHEGNAFDTILVAGPGMTTGQYVIPHPASYNGALGSYQVLVRARVGNRTPITNYAYTVAPSDPCAGSGPAACTLRVLRTSGVDTTAVAGAAVRVYNSEFSATVAVASTDLNGRAIVYVPPDTVAIIASHPAHTIAAKVIAVDIDGVSDTIWATAFDPGAPSSPDVCRVYGWVSDLAGDTIVGATVGARITSAPLRYGNVVISPYTVTTVTDSTGYWFLDLIPSSSLTPDTTHYELTIRYPSGAILRQDVTVPDTTEWLLDW
ncbi:MAG: hypothetical protein Kow0074_23710 [Candidatus Zixiibacteriota bacterium]